MALENGFFVHILVHLDSIINCLDVFRLSYLLKETKEMG